MTLKIALVGALFVFGSGAQAVTCQELVNYRDNYLAAAIGHSIDRNNQVAGARVALANLKSRVKSNRQNAQIVGDVSLVLQALKTASDAVGGIVSLAPGSSQVISGARGWAKRVLDGQTMLDRAQMDDPVSMLVYEMAQANGGLFGAAQTLKDFYGNLKALAEARREHDATLESLDNAIAVADRELAKLEIDLRKQETKINLINQVKNQIDAECNKR